MTTPYQRLTRLRERAVEVRDSLPIGSVEGEFYTDYIDLIDETLPEVAPAEPEPDEEPKEVVMPERFDFDAFLLDMFNPSRHMAVAVWE